VIHTVGPVWQGGDRGEDNLLASCYRRSVALCHEHALVSVAFPAISTGVYRFPAERAARIAVDTTLEAIEIETSLNRVIFCCFSEQSARLHDQALSEAIVNRTR
jgi:O-acetyl-ADP-ribose deacetylase (regulator of RNase III)